MKKILLAGAVVGMALGATLQTASAIVVTTTYVNAASGDDANAATSCQLSAPCKDINTAIGLLTTTNGGSVYILGAGQFGPVTIPNMSASTTINILAEPNTNVVISGNAAGSSNTGCVGTAASSGIGGCGTGTNHGYALEVDTGGATSTSVRLTNIVLSAGGGIGALHIKSVGTLSAKGMALRGNGSTTGPIVLIDPAVGTANQLYLKACDIGFSNGGGVLVQSTGSTNAKVAFIQVEVHNLNGYGIKADATGTSAGSGIAMSLADSSFFAMSGAGVTTLSNGGGAVNAILNNLSVFATSAAAYNNNGPTSYGVLTNVTFVGNAKGVSINGGGVTSSGNNTITGNGTVVSGTFVPADVVGGSMNVVPTK